MLKTGFFNCLRHGNASCVHHIDLDLPFVSFLFSLSSVMHVAYIHVVILKSLPRTLAIELRSTVPQPEAEASLCQCHWRYLKPAHLDSLSVVGTVDPVPQLGVVRHHSAPCPAAKRLIIKIIRIIMIIIIMKNFNRCSSHDHHGSKRCKLAQHAHSHGSHAFTHTLISTQLQPRCAKRQVSYYGIWNQFLF